MIAISRVLIHIRVSAKNTRSITHPNNLKNRLSSFPFSSSSSSSRLESYRSGVATNLNVSHQDTERTTVGATACYLAAYRGAESLRSEGSRLFEDPYGSALGGEIGRKFFEEGRGTPYGNYLYDLFAVRTRAIDEEVVSCLTENSVQQVVVLAAGLDSRPWRLKLPARKRSGESGGSVGLPYYEVDFPEIFEYKLPILKAEGAETEFDYRPVTADLSMPSWPQKLLDAGFDCKRRTLWVIEGLSMYLTAEETGRLLHHISDVLSVPRSKLVMDFLQPHYRSDLSKKEFSAVFRNKAANPLEVLNAFGWVGVQNNVLDSATKYGRKLVDGNVTRGDGYVLVCVEFEPLS